MEFVTMFHDVKFFLPSLMLFVSLLLLVSYLPSVESSPGCMSIAEKHNQHPWLGEPTTAILNTPDKIGTYQLFDGGTVFAAAIYAAEDNCAFQVHGSIGGTWMDLGAENSVFGFPITDELDVPGGGGKYSAFEGGIICWSAPNGEWIISMLENSVDPLDCKQPTIDTDNDGIFDVVDQCNVEPETYNNFQDDDGCPDTVPLVDTDGDGIFDNIDQCKNESENYNGYLDADGCPDTDPATIDTDGDGIFDNIDQCKNESENYNGYLDADGCPDVLDPKDIPLVLDIQTAESGVESIGIVLDKNNIDGFTYFNDYDAKGFCVDIFVSGTFGQDDDVEEIELKIRTAYDNDMFNDWMYVIVDKNIDFENMKSICDKEKDYSASELYSEPLLYGYGFSTGQNNPVDKIPDYSLIESTAKDTHGILKFEIFNAEKDLPAGDSTTKSIQITLIGDSYSKWGDYLFDNAVQTKNLNPKKYNVIVDEGSWRSSCTGLHLYENSIGYGTDQTWWKDNNPELTNPDKEITIDRKFFDAKTDFYVFVLPTGKNFSCNDIVDVSNDPNLVKHKLTSTPTHRTLSFQIPSEIMSEMISVKKVDYEIVVLGDVFGQNTASGNVNLADSDLIKTWKVGVTKMPKHWEKDYGGVVDYAFDYWKSRVPGIDFVNTEKTLGNDFAIQWKSKASDNVLGYYSDTGLGGGKYVGITLGYLEDSKMILIDQDYVKQLLTHEIGHAIGFEHANDDEDVMYAYIYDYGGWKNAPKNFDPRDCKDCMMFLPEDYVTKQETVPTWIKTNAGWWADGAIDDDAFVQGIQHLIKEKVIKVDAIRDSDSSSNDIPTWIKTNAGWWADGTIDDQTFLNGIKFLVESGIIDS